MFHSVPRPAMAYLDEEEGGSNHEIFTRIRKQEGEEEGEELKNEKSIYRRSVLLFNTWSDDHVSCSTGSVSGDHSPDYTLVHGAPFQVKHELPVNIQGYHATSVMASCQCRPVSTWAKLTPITKLSTAATNTHSTTPTTDTDSSTNLPLTHNSSTTSATYCSSDEIRLKIGLLGDVRRRGRSARFIDLLTTRDIRAALQSEDAVYITETREKISAMNAFRL